MKIITFTKNNQFQALLQFSDPVNAQQAKLVIQHLVKKEMQQELVSLLTHQTQLMPPSCFTKDYHS